MLFSQWASVWINFTMGIDGDSIFLLKGKERASLFLITTDKGIGKRLLSLFSEEIFQNGPYHSSFVLLGVLGKCKKL
jgi:hypothetical protein